MTTAVGHPCWREDLETYAHAWIIPNGVVPQAPDANGEAPTDWVCTRCAARKPDPIPLVDKVRRAANQWRRRIVPPKGGSA